MIQSCRRPNESPLRSAPGFRSRGDPSLGNCGNEREWAANRRVKAPPGIVNSGGAITYLSAPGRIRTCDLMLRRHGKRILTHGNKRRIALRIAQSAVLFGARCCNTPT